MRGVTGLTRGLTKSEVLRGNVGDNVVKASDEKVRQMATNLKTDEAGVRRMIDSMAHNGGTKDNLRQNIRYSAEVRNLIDNFPENGGGHYLQIDRSGRGRGNSNAGMQQAIDKAMFSGDLNKANELVAQARRQNIRVITPEQRVKIAAAEVNFQKRIDATVLEKSAELEDLQRQIYLATGELRGLERTVQIDNEFRTVKIGLDGKVEVSRIADALKGKAAIAADELKARIAQAQLSGQNVGSLSKIVESGGKYLRVTVDEQGNVKEQKIKKLEAKIEQAVERLHQKQLEHFQRTGELKSFKEKIKVGGKKFEITLKENGEVKVKQKKSFFQKAFGFIGKLIFPVLSIATMLIPGLQPIALGLKIFGAIKGGVESIIGKSWMGLIGSTLGAFSGGFASTLQKGFSVLQTGYNVVKNGIKSVWDGIGTVAGVVSNLANGDLSKIANYFGAGAGIIGGVVSGDIGGALLGIGNLVGGEVKNSRLARNLERFQQGLEIPHASLNELKAAYNFKPEEIAAYNSKRETLSAQTQNFTPSLDQVAAFAKELRDDSNVGGKTSNTKNDEVIALMKQNALRRGLTPEQTEIYIAQGLKLAQETKDKSTTQLALESAARRNLTPEQTLDYLKQGERLAQETATKSPTILAFEAAERRGMNAQQTIAYIKRGEQLAQETKNIIVSGDKNQLFPIQNNVVEISDTPGVFVANGETYSTNINDKGIVLLSDRIIQKPNETKDDAIERYFNIKLVKDGQQGTHRIVFGKDFGVEGFDAWIVPNGVNNARPTNLSPQLKSKVSTIESELYQGEQDLAKGKPAATYDREKLQAALRANGLPESYIDQVLEWNGKIAERDVSRDLEARKQIKSKPQATSLNDLRTHINDLKNKDTSLNNNLAFNDRGLSDEQYQAFNQPRIDLKANTEKVDRIANTLERLQESSRSKTPSTAKELTEFNNALADAKGLGLISDSLYTQLDGQRKQLQQQLNAGNNQNPRPQTNTSANPVQNQPATSGFLFDKELELAKDLGLGIKYTFTGEGLGQLGQSIYNTPIGQFTRDFDKGVNYTLTSEGIKQFPASLVDAAKTEIPNYIEGLVRGPFATNPKSIGTQGGQLVNSVLPLGILENFFKTGIEAVEGKPFSGTAFLMSTVDVAQLGSGVVMRGTKDINAELAQTGASVATRELTGAEKTFLNQLNNNGSAIVPKDQVSLGLVARLTKETGNDFLVLEREGQRQVIMGDTNSVGLSSAKAQNLVAQGWSIEAISTKGSPFQSAGTGSNLLVTEDNGSVNFRGNNSLSDNPPSITTVDLNSGRISVETDNRANLRPANSTTQNSNNNPTLNRQNPNSGPILPAATERVTIVPPATPRAQAVWKEIFSKPVEYWLDSTGTTGVNLWSNWGTGNLAAIADSKSPAILDGNQFSLGNTRMQEFLEKNVNSNWDWETEQKPLWAIASQMFAEAAKPGPVGVYVAQSAGFRRGSIANETEIRTLWQRQSNGEDFNNVTFYQLQPFFKQNQPVQVNYTSGTARHAFLADNFTEEVLPSGAKAARVVNPEIYSYENNGNQAGRTNAEEAQKIIDSVKQTLGAQQYRELIIERHFRDTNGVLQRTEERFQLNNAPRSNP